MQPPKPLRPLLVLTGLTPNMMFCLQTADATKRAYFQLEHTPAAIDAWGTTRRTRFTGPPVAMCLELNKGPLVSAWRQYDFLVLFPINP